MQRCIAEDVKDNKGIWLKGYTAGDTRYATKSAVAWYSIRWRCNPRGVFQKRKPTYRTCEMSENFRDFQFFTRWYREQVGYNCERYALDKDILNKGNKLYSEHTCVLVPQELNGFLTACDAKRGDLPQGVYFDKQASKYKAQIQSGGKVVNIGRYFSINAAKDAYKVAKDAEARQWYNRLIKGEFIVDARVIERMRTWEHICDWKPA